MPSRVVAIVTVRCIMQGNCILQNRVEPGRARRNRTRSQPSGSVVLHQLMRLALEVLEPTAHEERLLGEVVVLAVADLLERLDRLLDRDGRAGDAGELLGGVG